MQFLEWLSEHWVWGTFLALMFTVVVTHIIMWINQWVTGSPTRWGYKRDRLKILNADKHIAIKKAETQHFKAETEKLKVVKQFDGNVTEVNAEDYLGNTEEDGEDDADELSL